MSLTCIEQLEYSTQFVSLFLVGLTQSKGSLRVLSLFSAVCNFRELVYHICVLHIAILLYREYTVCIEWWI